MIIVGLLVFVLDTYVEYNGSFLERPDVRLSQLKAHLLFKDGLQIGGSGSFPIDPRIIYHLAAYMTIIALIINRLKKYQERNQSITSRDMVFSYSRI